MGKLARPFSRSANDEAICTQDNPLHTCFLVYCLYFIYIYIIIIVYICWVGMIVPQNFQCLLGIQHSSPLKVVFVPFVVLGFNKMLTPQKKSWES